MGLESGKLGVLVTIRIWVRLVLGLGQTCPADLIQLARVDMSCYIFKCYVILAPTRTVARETDRATRLG